MKTEQNRETMFWRLMLVTAVALELGSIVVSAAVQCPAHAKCMDCINDRNCLWVECANASGTSVKFCVNTTDSRAVGCIAVGTCAAPANISTTTENPVTTTNTTETSANVTVTTLTPTPTKRTYTFDAASFIGGIVMVLVLQILIFFIYKFFKFRDINYGTL